LPDRETVEAASFPPQKCIATVRCNIAVTIKNTSDMEIPFFITLYRMLFIKIIYNVQCV